MKTRPMRPEVAVRRFDWFTILAFVPAALFVVILIYIRGYDGWGAWTAAPLLLLPIIVSIPVTLVGIYRLVRERSSGETGYRTPGLVAVSAVPLFWFAWRLLVTSI